MNEKEIRGLIKETFACYHRTQDGTRLAEQVSPIKTKKWGSSVIHETIYLDTSAINDVAFCVRLIGPDYLQSLSISQVAEKMRDIVHENYWRVPFSNAFAAESVPVAVIGEEHLNGVDEYFIEKIVKPKSLRFLFPCTPLRTTECFDFENWGIYPPAELHRLLPQVRDSNQLRPDQMPPLPSFGKNAKPVGAWLQIKSPAEQHAQKLKRVVLGAMALAQIKRERHQFSHRANCNGYSQVDDGVAISSSPPHMPPVSNILLDGRDREWLTLLAHTVKSIDKKDVKKRNALEYYYRAWFLGDSERCPLFFSALEALFDSSKEQSTKGIKSGILGNIPEITDEHRLSLIMDLRGSIVHGGSPDAYSSKTYRRYYRRYKADIVDDIELVTERCLRDRIFPRIFRVQADPHEKIISEYQGYGVLPRNEKASSIL